MTAQESPESHTRPAVAREDPAFPWYIGAALAVAVAGGFALAALLPLAAVLDWGWGVRWRALAQAHGHLQVGGWLGLFIAGMAVRLAPRFAGRPLRFAGVTTYALALLVVGLLGRAVAQPWLDLPGMRGALIASALAELVGVLLVASALTGTLVPVATTLPSAPLFLFGAAGMTAQAALSALWLSDITADYPALAPDRDGALLTLQFYAFVLPFIFGVSLRALPTFFKRPPLAVRRAWVLAIALGAGAALHAGAPLLVDGAGGVRLQQVGALLIAGAIGGAVVQTGAWRQPERLRPAARHIVVLIRTALAWLVVAAAWLAVDAVAGLRDGTPVQAAYADGIRHMLALGVFTTMIVGMAQLMLPWLAMRRQRPATTHLEMWTLWALLTSATALRVLSALLESRGAGAGRYWFVATGGVLGIVAMAYFAVTIIRAARRATPEIPVQVRAE